MNEREAFEAWFNSEMPMESLITDQDNDYKYQPAIASWEAWQAALASQAQQEPKELTDKLTETVSENRDLIIEIQQKLIDKMAASQAQQSQWFSVEERLPEENCHVLVACEGGNVATTFYAIDHSFFDHAHGHKLSRKKHGKYSKHFELARQYGYKITHWMPLPPAPEGE